MRCVKRLRVAVLMNAGRRGCRCGSWRAGSGCGGGPGRGRPGPGRFALVVFALVLGLGDGVGLQRGEGGGEHVNRPGFDGGSDDMEGSLSWDRRSTLMSCASAPRGRPWRRWPTQHGPRRAVCRIGEELGVHPEALQSWVKKAQVDGGLRSGTTTDQAQRIKELEKEVRELRRANAIPKSTVGLSIAVECERPSR